MSEFSLQLINLILSGLQSIGVIIAVIAFIGRLRKERKDSEVLLYEGSRSSYIDYLSVCRDYPELDIYDIPLNSPPKNLTPEQQRIESIAFSQLLSLFERAYILRNPKKKKFINIESSNIESQEWNNYIKMFAKRKNFRDTWKRVSMYYDKNFAKHMEVLIKDVLQDSPDTSEVKATGSTKKK